MLLLEVVTGMDETVVELGCVVAAFFALIVDVYNCGPCLLLFINFNLLPWLLVLLVLLMFSLFLFLLMLLPLKNITNTLCRSELRISLMACEHTT